MRGSTLFIFAAATIGWTMAQDSVVCTAAGLLGCVEAPLSTTCADYPCACSQLSYQTACYKSFCPDIPLPSGVLTAYSNVCIRDGGGGGSTLAATTAAGTGNGATVTGASSAAGAGSGAATPTGTAASTSTSKAAANMGFVVPAGGVLAAVLGVVVYL